ncbi:MAG: hypothetical protein AAGA64_12220 [Bacteroidota bacterium]
MAKLLPERTDLHSNAINDFILDETSETLWMAINKIGIVKANFDIPSVYVIQLTLDKEGKL